MTEPPDVVVCGRGVPGPGSPLLGIFELDQARALADDGLSVVYAALDVRSVRRRRPWGLRHHVVDGVRVVELSVPLGRLPRALNRVLMTRLWDVLLAAVVRRHGRPRLLHGHFLPWTAPLAGARLLRGAAGVDAADGGRARPRLVVTEHWSQLQDRIDPAVRALGQAVYPRCDAVVAVSRPLAETIGREFGVAAEVVPDIIDVDTFAPMAGTPREPGVRLVATGNLIVRKNFDGLLRAFAAAAPPDARLTIIGQGPERERLEARAQSLGVADRVRFAGRLARDEMAAEYGGATGFALASHAETFGVVWAEAMAAGLPVLATRCGGPEDFVTDDDGVIVEDTDEALAAGMAQLCAGITAGRWDAAATSARAGARFSAPAVVAQLRQVYATLEP
ncbi:glycosyltransferase [Aestuariimicrobium sp. Y1814]|uniref:glycosyltransferase n=1 Tax=Aestuariimicrobium sp. Y1814 TaxID=3418742 RepID=UPI003DA758D9